MQKPQNKKYAGFLLAEVLFCAAIIIAGAAMLAPQYNAWQREYSKQHVHVAAQALVEELRALQRRTMFATGSQRESLEAHEVWYSLGTSAWNRRAVFLREFGCSDLYLSQMIDTMKFTPTGAPSASGTYILRHKNVEDFACRIVIDPVTGRITMYEDK